MASPRTLTLSRDEIQVTKPSVTLITGGVAGIGLETALLLHSLHTDNRVVILDRASKEQCMASTSFVESSRVLFLQCDVTDWSSLRAGFKAAEQRYGGIDNVFVNAGINEYGNQLLSDDLDVQGALKEPDHRVLSIDLNAAVNTVKLAIHHMRSKKNDRGGSIVLTASLAGYLASAGAPLYSAAKHAIIGLMRSLKNDVAKLGIAISIVAPGITLTDLVAGRGANESLHDWAVRMRAAGVPINDPAEVATAVVWLMSLGAKANGKGLLIQAGKVADAEEGIAKSRKHWMNTDMLELFKGGRNAPLFPNKL